MEIVLLILAGVVIYYLYITLQEYLKNPVSIEKKDTSSTSLEYDIAQDPYVQADPLEKLRKSEFGIMSLIVTKIIPNYDKKEVENILIEGLLEDIANTNTHNFTNSALLKDIQEILRSNQKDSQSLEQLCKQYLQATYGEYKKRLKLVEFLFALAYADGTLEESERENIIDIAAFLELSNDDFNQIYDDFEAQNKISIEIDHSKSLQVLGFEDSMDTLTSKALKENFELALKKAKQNILEVKNTNKSFALTSFAKLKETIAAYNLLKTSLMDSLE